MSTSAILKAIDIEHKAKCQIAWDAYDRRMKPARDRLQKAKQAMASAERAFRAHERGADAEHKEAVAEAQRWRTEARQAASGDRRPTVSEIVAVERRTASGAKVSLARVSCLEMNI